MRWCISSLAAASSGPCSSGGGSGGRGRTRPPLSPAEPSGRLSNPLFPAAQKPRCPRLEHVNALLTAAGAGGVTADCGKVTAANVEAPRTITRLCSPWLTLSAASGRPVQASPNNNYRAAAFNPSLAWIVLDCPGLSWGDGVPVSRRLYATCWIYVT